MNFTKPAKYISYLFIPPVMNLFIFTVYSIEFEEYPNSLIAIAISFTLGLFMPVIVFLNFRRKGLLADNDATIKEERTLPYIYAIGFSLSGVLLSGIFKLNEKLIMLWMIYLVTSILIININKHWKISAHALGVAIALGALVNFSNSTMLLITTVILFLVSFSRLYLKVHTFFQVIAGALVGFFVSYILLNYCFC